jgi:DNA-binding MarR family transcriptional regulator
MTPERGLAQGLDPTLRHALRRVYRTFNTKLTQRLAEHGVSEAEYVIMFTLRRIPGMSNADLARGTGVSPQVTNEVLKTLIANGMVERHPAPDHGRILEACLTEQGEETIAACEDSANALEGEMCVRLEPHEVIVLEDLLRRCADGLGVPISDHRVPPKRPARQSARPNA